MRLNRMMEAGVRGAHPWCGWLRLLLLPVALVPAWYGHMWAGVLLMMLWMTLPAVFPKPVSNTAWMSRACLGVQVWRSRPLDDSVCLLLVGLVAASLGAALLLGPQRWPWTVATIGLYAAAYLVYLGRAARLYAARGHRP